MINDKCIDKRPENINIKNLNAINSPSFNKHVSELSVDDNITIRN